MINHVTADGADRFPGGRHIDSFGDAQKTRLEHIKRHRKNFVDFDVCEDSLYGEFVAYCETHVTSLDHINQYLRYCQTFKNIYQSLQKSDRIAEAGGFSMISEFLLEKGYDCTALIGDLRYQIVSDDAQYDVMFSLETLEHIKDHNSDELLDIVNFNFSGMKTYMAEMARVLVPGGRLYLTTPNANSLLVFDRWSRHSPAFMSPVHIRELTKSEIVDLANPYFTMSQYKTTYCYGLLDDRENSRRAKLLAALESLGDSTEDRGDNHFFCFKKT